MRTELPHNVIVVTSVNSGVVLHTSCEPCRASSLGRCCHVVAVLFSVLDYVQKHRPQKHVKNFHEQATIQRLHFVRSFTSFGKDTNTFCPEFSNSFSDSGHFSGYLEFVLHSPQQQCLAPTISLISRMINRRIYKNNFRF